LLVVRRSNDALSHRRFHDLPALLDPRDLLVLNDTRVVPARLLGRRQRTGGKWEGLFLRETSDGAWEVLCQTRGRLAEGETILVDPARDEGRTALPLILLRRTDTGHWLARPEPAVSSGVHRGLVDHTRGSGAGTPELLSLYGHIPLPPYIRKGRAVPGDDERYQTVYARQAGAVAAPTAGLHFTRRLFDSLRQRGIGWAFVTLHVGAGTFQPIQTQDIAQHRMHAEWGELPAATADAIQACKERGGRVVAVGTTAVRVLETVAASGPLRPWSGATELYIFPPYRFRVVDALVTNFHLPRSTLLVLVSAFAGVALVRTAYKTAMESDYRFYSYGDAMLIL
jgi:S-adenosylmethionine:tRNA ribosyltransferase-isomerase